ncbi:MAG: PRC-barrel domain-containing protein [Bacillus sp. (in: Bacteria)]|nr:PRC-barrel domain-containing protein [Bacillus sp. (in: firmicutes)]
MMLFKGKKHYSKSFTQFRKMKMKGKVGKKTMLVHLKGTLTSCSVVGKDGTFGTVEDVLLDAESWMVRYFTVHAGNLLNKEKLFLPPEKITFMDWLEEKILVNISYERTIKSTKLNAEPVNPSRENDLSLYYRFHPYWVVGSAIGGIQGPTMGGAYPQNNMKPSFTMPEAEVGQSKQNFLHYGKKIIGYDLACIDDSFGRIIDLLIDERNFKVSYVIASTKKVMPGKTVLISTDKINEIDWKRGKLRVDALRQQIETSPEYMFGKQVTPEMEKEIKDHYK